jgi:hypothetical protein
MNLERCGTKYCVPLYWIDLLCFETCGKKGRDGAATDKAWLFQEVYGLVNIKN